MHEVFASLFNDRAIAYRVHQGFDHALVALSAGVQRMVRSDLGASGVMFTLDTESGFRDVVFITASYGLGETVVQGAVNPDEFYVYKPALRAGHGRRSCAATSAARRSRWSTRRRRRPSACARRRAEPDRARASRLRRRRSGRGAGAPGADHRGALRPPDGHRVGQGRRPASSTSCRRARDRAEPRRPHDPALHAQGKLHGARDRAAASASASAPAGARVRDVARWRACRAGDVLVADMTDPDWEPIMKRASAIVTNRGGRTCHAAIIARELGIPAVVGCGDATSGRRRPETSPCPAPRATPAISTRRSSIRAVADRTRRAAADTGQDHDERRQPGSRLRLRRRCRTPASASRASSSSSTA
jgi:pyruvate, water dikinase